MSAADIKLNLAQGTLTGPPPGGGVNTYHQGMEFSAANNSWTNPSIYWYYYTGSNKPGSNGLGGQVNISPDSDNDFTVGPHDATENITSIICHDLTSVNHYQVTGPDSSGIYTIGETEHTDPEGSNDSFDVYANVKASGINSAGPTVKCDPIIRNRN